MSSIEVREIKEEYAHPQSGMMSKLQLAESMCTKSIIPYDSFGPEKVIIVKEPGSDLLGFLVIDCTAPGPRKGGLRMAPDVAVDDVFRLARIMTWKCAIAGVREGFLLAGLRLELRQIQRLSPKIARAS